MEMQLIQEERQIIIYSKRSRMFKTFIFLAVGDCIVLFCLCQIFLSIISSISSFPTFPAYGVAIICFVYLIVLGAFILVLPPFCWFNFIVLRNWLSPQQILNINKQGITVSAQPIIKGAYVPWDNIAKLHLARSSFPQGTNLYLLPRDINSLFSSRFQRLCWRWFSARGVFLGSWLLAVPDEDLSAQIKSTFKNELSQYEIKLEQIT